MKFYLFVLFCLFTDTLGCWSRSKAPPAKPHPPPAVEEQIVANNIQDVNSRRQGGNKPNQGGGGNRNNPNQVTTASLKFLSQELADLDRNSVVNKLQLDYQGQTSSKSVDDVAPNKLFKSVEKNALSGATTSTFVKLLNNYVPDVTKRDDISSFENKEIRVFLDAVMKTKVMKRVEKYLKDNKLLQTSLRPALEAIWFTPYSRHRGVLGSSGFEHVFLGEVKQGKVSGFHNWIYFMQKEKKNEINYMGHMRRRSFGNEGEILQMRFVWKGIPKSFGSMFVGTSPEFELALYTVCFYARPNSNCRMNIGKNDFRIKVYQQNYRGQALVGSAYPEI